MNINLKRYELFGWEYEQFNPINEKEVDWYLRFAKSTGGPVLELACGTGRLLVSIARAGFDIHGIDLSTGMLAIAKKEISQLQPEIRARIRIHNMDMSNFRINRKFGLIFIADNSFRELNTHKEQLRCLKCVYNHLRPNGKFLITERRFDPTKYIDNRRDIPWSEPIQNPTTGDLLSRKIVVQISDDEKRISGVMYYKIITSNGKESIEECPFEGPIMLTDDYISLLFDAGFTTKVYVGYKNKKDDGKDPILCFVCEKR
jgi:SAM-dependent methyltransferase